MIPYPAGETAKGLGCSVGLRTQGLGLGLRIFRTEGSGFRVENLGFRAQDLPGLGLRV